MHPNIGIVCTFIRSDGLSMRLDDQNTLTCQSADTNDPPPRDPLHVPVTCNPSRIWSYSMRQLCLHLRLQYVTIVAITAMICQDTSHRCIRYTTLSTSSESAVPCLQPFPTGLDSIIFCFV